MACRRASHRNRRCARRSHPARRRPAASLRDRRSCPASIVPRSTGRSREPRRACFSPDVAVNLPGRDRLRQFWPRSDHVSPCRCPVGNSGSPLFRPLPDVGAQTHAKPGSSRALRFGRIPGRKTGKKNGAGDFAIADPRAPPPRARPAPVPIPATPDGRGAAAGAMWLSARTVPTLARRLPGDRIPPQPSPGRRPCLPPSAPMISTTTTSS